MEKYAFIALIHLEALEGLAVKGVGKAVLISLVEVEVGLDMAGGFVLGGITVTGLTGTGTGTGTFGVVAASRGFSGFGSGIMLSGSQLSWYHCQWEMFGAWVSPTSK